MLLVLVFALGCQANSIEPLRDLLGREIPMPRISANPTAAEIEAFQAYHHALTLRNRQTDPLGVGSRYDFSQPPPPQVQLPRQGFALVDYVTGTTLDQRLNGLNRMAARAGERVEQASAAVGAATQYVTQSGPYRAVADSAFMT